MTSANLQESTSAVWFLLGPFDSTETTRCRPIHSVPFAIGRCQDLALSLSCPTVSYRHAEIVEANESLVLCDLASTNGTYVNGRRITSPTPLQIDDLVQFANVAFRVQKQAAHGRQHTVQEDARDQALALVQFDTLMAQRAVTPFFQPIVSMADGALVGYEILGRSTLFGLETPYAMFRVASQLNLEVKLSEMLRWEGLEAARALPADVPMFVNTHPRELVEPDLLASLHALRAAHPDSPLVLEIHESAVTDPAQMAAIRQELVELQIGLAYDDFGAGQSRLNELTVCPPDYLKFDMSLLRGIDASLLRQQVVAALVKMVRELGIRAIAEGVETAAEHEACRRLNFDLGQGFFYGHPAPARAYRRPNQP